MTSNTSPAQSHRSRLCLSRECPFLCVVPAWHPHLYCTVSMSPHKKKPSPVSMSKMNICSQEVCKIGYESQERACLIPCGANRMDGQGWPVSTKIFMFISSRTRASLKTKMPSMMITSDAFTCRDKNIPQMLILPEHWPFYTSIDKQ
jgi:hypothetical protein